MADPTDRRVRPATFARALAAGVGGGVATPRSNARGVGPARLAPQVKFAVAQHQRILGCHMVADLSLGGCDDSRLAFRSTDAAQAAGLYFYRRAHAGTGYRCEHR